MSESNVIPMDSPEPLATVTPWGELQVTSSGLVRLEAQLKGLRFNKVIFKAKTFWTGFAHEPIGIEVSASVSGSAAALERHGFCERQYLKTPACGFRHYRNAEGGRFTVKRNHRGFRVSGKIIGGIQIILCALIPWQAGFPEMFHDWRDGKLKPRSQAAETAPAAAAVRQLRLVVDNTRGGTPHD